MASLDTLPADQRAVIGLLLRQGKSYDELSSLLRLDAETVRERAHAALAALGPQGVNGLDPERRAELADFLLGQGSEADHEAARVVLASSSPARGWARGVAAQLAPLAPTGLPEIPADPAPAPASVQRAGPRVSRRGGAFLLGAVAILAVAAVVTAVLVSGSSDSGDAQTAARVTGTTPSSTTATPSGTATTPSSSTTKVRAQANLTAAPGAPAPRALGVIQVVDVKGQRQLIAIVQGLPKPGRREGFGIWLTAPGGRHTWLGFFQSTDKQGRLIARGALRQPITGFDEMVVTRERGSAPKRLGRAYLRGRIQRPSATSGG